MSSQPNRFFSLALPILLCLACWAGGIAVRRTVLDAQRMLNPGGEIPFTLESALAFRRIQQAGQPGGLPRHDFGIGWPAGIEVRATDTTGEEGILLALSRGLPWPRKLSLAERVRWLHLLWWSLSIPALFLMVRRAGGGTAGATVAAAFWAVAITAVARSTGQELSHENVAWPFWAWHLAFWTFADAREWRGWPALLQGIASALLLSFALCAWDLMRFWLAFIALWAVVRLILACRRVSGGRPSPAAAARGDARPPATDSAVAPAPLREGGCRPSGDRGESASHSPSPARREALFFWFPLFVAYFAVSIFNRYHNTHLLLLSPLTLLLAVAAGSGRFSYRRWHLLVLLPLLIFVQVQVVGFMDPLHSYSHFSSLLWAKLRFLNIRPTDPALLTFEQRILWTPALNSTSPKLLLEWLPALGWLALLSAVWAFRKPGPRRSCESGPLPEGAPGPRPGGGVPPASHSSSAICHSSFVTRHSRFWSLFFAFSFLTFLLFFRFHVWMAWAACILAGLAFGAAWQRNWWWRSAALAAVLLAFGVETWNTLLGFEVRKNLDTLRKAPSENAEISPQKCGFFSLLPTLVRLHDVRWGRPNVYAVETAEMLDFLNREVAPEPVLANFGISGSIATYAGCPVVLHPKFETLRARQAVRGYLEALFKGGEDAFAYWMDERGATVYVHSMGELSNLAPELSPRFMVDALDPAPDAAVRLFEQRPGELTRFKLVFQNRKYRVYRLLPKPFEPSPPFVCPRERPRLAGVFEEIATRCAAVAGLEARAWAFAVVALRIDPDSPVAQELVRDLTEREPGDDPYDLTDDPWALDVLLEPPMLAPARSADGWREAAP